MRDNREKRSSKTAGVMRSHDDSARRRRSLIAALAVTALMYACGDSTQPDEPPASQPEASTQPEPTSGPGGDATRILEEVGSEGLRFEESDADVALNATQALAALAKHYDLGVLTGQPPEVILVEVVTRLRHSSFTDGQDVYVIYATGFEQIEYGPPPQSGSPEEFVITQAAFFIDANTGDFIKATWWE
jgi:hypothetical protein